MQIDWTVNVGNLLVVLTVVLAGVGVVWRFYGSFLTKTTAFEDLLKEHARMLVSHAARMEKQDELLLRIVGDVQRLVGRMESSHQLDVQAASAEAAKVIERAAAAAEKVIESAALSATSRRRQGD